MTGAMRPKLFFTGWKEPSFNPSAPVCGQLLWLGLFKACDGREELVSWQITMTTGGGPADKRTKIALGRAKALEMMSRTEKRSFYRTPSGRKRRFLSVHWLEWTDRRRIKAALGRIRKASAESGFAQEDPRTG